MKDTSYNPSTRNPIYATCAYCDNIKIQRIMKEGIRIITDFTKINSQYTIDEIKSVKREL